MSGRLGGRARIGAHRLRRCAASGAVAKAVAAAKAARCGVGTAAMTTSLVIAGGPMGGPDE
jgi:hypothetical protein